MQALGSIVLRHEVSGMNGTSVARIVESVSLTRNHSFSDMAKILLLSSNLYFM